LNLLGRARKMLQGLGPPEPPRPQYYNVACPEGHVLRGLRTESYQALRCPACGEGIFVLPRSPLPDPPAPPASRSRRPAPEPEADEGPILLTDPPAQEEISPAEDEIQWLDPAPPPAPAAPRAEIPIEFEEGPPTPAAKVKAAGPAPAPRKAPAAQPAPARRPRPTAPPAPTIAVLERPGLVERIKRHRVALVLAGVALVVVGTVLLKWRREWRQNLPLVAESNWKEGLEALDRGEFNSAKLKLGTAASALESLGDEKAGQVRQLAREAAILADLVGKSLEELIDDAAYKSEEWPSTFETLYKGRSILLDSKVWASSEGKPGFEIDYRIVGRGRRPKVGRIDLAGLKLFEDHPPKSGDRIRFGARLASIRLGPGDEWVVGLEPDSGVLMAHKKALEVLGLDVPEDQGVAWGLRPALLAALLPAPAAGADEVEPADLARRPELIGREVTVDDRIKLILYHQGRGFDEILLKQTPVRFRLPARLRYSRAPELALDGRLVPPGSARIRGTLRKTDDDWICDVEAVELLPDDLTRLDKGVAALGPDDGEGRIAWARWAERRAADFEDARLRARARQIQAEAIRIEAARPAANPAAHWLRLAERARSQHLDVEAAALAHRAFRARLAASRTASDLDQLAAAIRAFLPDAARPHPADLAAWKGPYGNDPQAAYLKAPADVRAALDRELLADALQKAIDLRAAAEPRLAVELARQAREELPDRPAVVARLLKAGQEALENRVESLRRDEVEELARSFESAGQPGRARDLRRRWLDDRKKGLSPRDAEGMVDLAEQYATMLGDKDTALDLLRQAERVAPNLKGLGTIYRRLGFRKVNDRWVASDPAPAREAADEPADRPAGDSLIGATREQVRTQLGEPDRKAWSATQGQFVEQWIYRGQRKTQYINFAPSLGSHHVTVQRRYSLP
jgi:tetratricopeptide (TPR) repeat protein